MEELIALFNEHIEENTGQKYYLNERDVKDKLDSLLILRYFIKWLVDNDKIDFEKVKDNSDLYIKFGCNDSEKGAFSKIILMLLSIQDNPIEFLVSILK